MATEMTTAATHVDVGGAPGSSALTDAAGLAPPISAGADMWRRFKRNRLAVVGLVIITVEVLAAIFAPVLTFTSPYKLGNLSKSGPSLQHWFGTDLLGRDLYSRVVYGARISLQVGIFSTIISVGIGLALGSIAGYYGRWLDSLLMRVTDIFLAFPYIIAALAIIQVVGRGGGRILFLRRDVFTVTVVIGLIGWMYVARIVRAAILQVKENEYIEAARATGANDWRIITRHILPNTIQPVIVYGTILVGTAVLSEAALSFLGQGITEPTPAWGLMVANGKGDLFTSPQLLFFPGAAIFLTVMAFVFIGDGLRDALDPKLR
jgi:peptide/nickel transport system permease protein/oligopeptide transport system permease protein